MKAMKHEVIQKVFKDNDFIAQQNREILGQTVCVNVMGAPGAGKTSIIQHLKKIGEVGIIEGDLATDIDAQKLRDSETSVIQLNTITGCHLNASHVQQALNKLPLKNLKWVFIENVGNLVCPSNFDLGEEIRIVVASAPQGSDKPLKYPPMFRTANIIIINKTDLDADFDYEEFEKGIRNVNTNAPILRTNCKTGKGIDELILYLKKYQ
ncbi:MAG: hydrogenase nickel incorporation protein HypB [Nanoarchaeota archaeon]|nr:hydrogenase nickel incorporation protein HypB [Nanoarchaeota archaeon]